MSDNLGRPLPNARVRRIMLAVQDVMGQSGLITILRQAGLQRYANALPPNDSASGLRAAEYAAMLQAIENYYGRGARGTLTRIGYAAFRRLVVSRKLLAGLGQGLLRLLPATARKLAALRWYAWQTAGRGSRLSIHLDDQQIQVLDHDSDATVGRQRDSEICWVTLGEIQEALKWGTGQEFEVAEMACRAKGDAACRFEIGGVIG
jgi:predicted hydrocarbon binding protein